MILPATIDPERLEDVTDDDLLAELVAFGYEEAAARFVIDVLRGREAPTD